MYFFGLLASFFLAMLVWLDGVGNPFLYIIYPAPVGQFYFVWSKLFGLLAAVVLTLQAILGLLTGMLNSDERNRIVRIHKLNGKIFVGVFGLHIGLFLLAASLRSGHFATKVLLLDFASYYSGRISLGLVAVLVLACTLLLPKLLYRFLPAGVSRFVHFMGVAAIPIVAVHAFSVGSETRSALAIAFYSLLAISLLMLLLVRSAKIFKRNEIHA